MTRETYYVVASRERPQSSGGFNTLDFDHACYDKLEDAQERAQWLVRSRYDVRIFRADKVADVHYMAAVIEPVPEPA